MTANNFEPTKMAPNGPRAQSASKGAIDKSLNPRLPEDLLPLDHSDPAKGPHPGHVQVACQYTLEQKLRRMLKDYGSDSAREDSYRLQGVSMMDSVREALHLPARTFDTAVFYYHLFRLCHRDTEYNHTDAALSSLFLACKVEDTIKKSKEILCAAYNIKNAEFPMTQDDKMFEQPSKIIIGLERFILETIGFDFRTRYVQKYLVKAIKTIFGKGASKEFFATTYEMTVDLHKTFAPIKQTTWTMALAVIDLTALMTETGVDEVRKVDPVRWHTTRADVVETMLDLLDLYTQNSKSTKLGASFDIKKFIDVKIDINNEVDSSRKLKRFPFWCERCSTQGPPSGFVPVITPCFTQPVVNPGSTASPTAQANNGGPVKRASRSAEGTMRFIFDMDQANDEKTAVDSYLHEDYDEVTMDIVELVPDSERPTQPRDRRHDGWGSHPYGRGRDRRRGGHRHH